MTPPVGRRPILRGWWRKVLAVVLVAGVVFAAATARVLIWPPQGAPLRVDAIVMLAGQATGSRLRSHLLGSVAPPTLLSRQGWMGYGGPCPPPTPGVRTVCFDPDPGTTRGEAEYVSKLAGRYGWHSLIVVATRPQAVRARLLMGRCFTGTTYVITAPLPLSSWPYQIVYGWAALFKALLVVRGC